MVSDDCGTPRIFLWEDLTFFRTRLSEILEESELEVMKGTGFKNLVEALIQNPPPPDLLLLPVGRLSPSMISMVQELRATPGIPPVPILGITPLDRSGLDLTELRHLGFSGLIDKRAQPEHVIFRVNQLVRDCDPRRRHDRAPACFPIDLEIGGVLRTEYVLSLSIGGMRFTSGSSLAGNTDITARFRVSEATDDFIEVRARVLYALKRVGGSGVSPYEIGASFYPLDGSARLFMEAEVRRLLDECQGMEFGLGRPQEGASLSGTAALRLIVVDGSEADRNQIQGLLSQEYPTARVLTARDGVEALQLLHVAPADLVLCGLDTPLLNRSALLESNRSSQDRLRIPVIFLDSGPRDPDREAQLIEDGGFDVISKPLHANQVMSRVRHHLKMKQLCEELLGKNDSLAEEATTDLLTGLRNRRFLFETLKVEISRAHRHGTELSVLLLDIDGFKEINDRFGHVEGDAVLNRVARLLSSKTRTTDVAARYGGDELVWVLTHNSAEGALTCADRLRSEVEKISFQYGQTTFRVTVSIGVASYGNAATSAEELIASADKALYSAKQLGRNRVECHPAAPPSSRPGGPGG